jgi:Cu/Ag efflux pump CusA
VILGGLATSTLLNLLVVPALYLRFAKSKTTDPTIVRGGIPVPESA